MIIEKGDRFMNGNPYDPNFNGQGYGNGQGYTDAQGYPMEQEPPKPPGYRKLPDGFYIDENYLLSLGFYPNEVQYFCNCINNLGSLTKTKLMALGEPGNSADMLVYMYRICSGTVNNGAGLDLNGAETLSKHLKYLFKCRYFTGDPEHDLQAQSNLAITKEKFPHSRYTELPRRVEIVNIPKNSKFSIYNSENYAHYDKLYTVKPGTNMGQNITIQTDKQPRLAYRESRELEGVLKLGEVSKTGVVELSVNREYIKMHNVFYITANIGDIKSPEHYGGMKIVAWDGTIITIRVEVWMPRASMAKKVENKRVYEIGFFPEEVKPKLYKVAKQFYSSQLVQGVKIEAIEPTLDFTMITENPDEEEFIIE